MTPTYRAGRDLRLLIVVVAVAAFRYSFTTEAWLDPSWELALGWLHERGFSHGTDIIFTFGPLGPVSNPTLGASRAWIAASLVAHVVAAAWFAWVLLASAAPHQPDRCASPRWPWRWGWWPGSRSPSPSSWR